MKPKPSRIAAITPWKEVEQVFTSLKFNKISPFWLHYAFDSNYHHFTGLLSEAEGIGLDVDVGSPLQLISTVRGDVELNVVSLQKRHLGLCVLLTERQFLVGETNAGTDAARQRVIL